MPISVAAEADGPIVSATYTVVSESQSALGPRRTVPTGVGARFYGRSAHWTRRLPPPHDCYPVESSAGNGV